MAEYLDQAIDLRLVFDLDDLRWVRDTLLARQQEGLAADGREIAMLPAFLPPCEPGTTGRAVALDAGGTNLRAAMVELKQRGTDATVGEVISRPLPGSAGTEPADMDRFFASHAEVLTAVNTAPGTPLGYCFSYPVRSRPDGDAVLTRWVKEIHIEGMIGQPVGQLLRQHLEERGLRPGPIAVLNDTIATLMAGSLAPGVVATRCCGLIVGTGTNMGAFLPVTSLGKLGSTAFEAGHMAVNFESGAYDPPGLGEIDQEVDRTSTNPGDQRFEKAVSGAYLGRVLEVAARCLAIAIPPGDATAAVVSRLAEDRADAPANRLARLLLARSADLVAAALAATHLLLGACDDLYVCAEGTLFWKGPGYAARVKNTLNRLMRDNNPASRCHIDSVPHANLIGSTAAVLGRRRMQG